MGELTWWVPWKRLDEKTALDAALAVAMPMEGVVAEVELEEEDTLSMFFEIQEPGEGSYVVELSFYDLDSDGVMMRLEEEWSDNREAWDAACDLAEALAEQLDARPMELD